MIWMAMIMGLPVLGIALFFLSPWQVALPSYLILVGASVLFDWMMMRAMRLPVKTGLDALIGSSARVLDWSGDSGQVAWRNEIWQARASGAGQIEVGEDVTVEALSELTLIVRPAGDDSQPNVTTGLPAATV